jgi:glycerol-3-phosphate acyltransferase PlsY
VDALLFLLLTYLVAAVPFGLLLTMLAGGDVDPRSEGSGNIGATNVARLYGWGLGARVMLLDAGKGFAPVAIAGLLFPEWGLRWQGAVAMAAFVGHCFPVYLSFSGGKGVATTAGSMLAMLPGPTAVAVLVWGVMLRVSGRSSVASLLATVTLVAITAMERPDALWVVGTLGMGVFAMHSSNIRRLISGREAPLLPPVRLGHAARQDEEDVDAWLGQGPAGGAPPPSLWPSSDEGDG